ncbi:enoyl-CoA hydratase/isomerase family protein [Pseudomonadales bacterium]|nr:enoyl-CoA hydratase/isomerase family protein [Pseudomonadales bacterium]
MTVNTEIIPNSTTAQVSISEFKTSGAMSVGHAHLNMVASLNALTLDAVRALTAAVLHWSAREDIAGVLITGEGEKAFCAGGDIQALYRAAVANRQAGELVDLYPFEFFAEEYRLDYVLHTFNKPVITLGHGIVMGGGYGLFAASAYRVLTQRSKLAFPEITIGLFPDAGGSWVLKNLPQPIALFLGLTGSQVNATDALALNIGTHMIDHEQRQMFVDGLATMAWSEDDAGNRALLHEYLLSCSYQGQRPEPELSAFDGALVEVGSLSDCVTSIVAMQGKSAWIDRGIGNLQKGCPVTAGIIFEQMRRVKTMTLAESFRMELAVATRCLQWPDFTEGVRALLIDKDSAPKWTVNSVDDLSKEYIDAHFDENFVGLWAHNPLHDLG